MIEETIREYLSGALDVPVWMEVPRQPPDRFVVAEKTGSSRENHINQAMIALQSYGETLHAAAVLNEQVKAAMDRAEMLESVCKVQLNGDYNFTDTSTGRYRYQAIYDIAHY